jgi:hypothetical protein
LNLLGGYYQTTKQEEFYDKLSTRQDTVKEWVLKYLKDLVKLAQQ